MNILVLGGTGNIGSAVVRMAVRYPEVAGLRIAARRRPERLRSPAVAFVPCDLRTTDLEPLLGLLGGRVPVLPVPRGLRFQVVHSDDVARAILDASVAITGSTGPPMRRAFNVAAPGVLDRHLLGELQRGVTVPLPRTAVRPVVQLAFATRLTPTHPGWLDMALRAPLEDTSALTEELGWKAEISSRDTLAAALDGIDHGWPAPPLEPGWVDPTEVDRP